MIMGWETFEQADDAQLSLFHGLIEPPAVKMPQNGRAR
jgi:hypothetical protein